MQRRLKSGKPGAQGRIRTSVARKERQIYSLLPLTARPPVPIHPTTASIRIRTRRDAGGLPANSEHATQWDHRGVEARRSQHRDRRQTIAAFSLSTRGFRFVELAKGFEPPTL